MPVLKIRAKNLWKKFLFIQQITSKYQLKNAFAARHTLHVTRRSDSHSDSTGERLENGFQTVMVIVAIEQFHMQIHAGVFAKTFEEMLEHARFDSACGRRREFYIPDKTDAVAEIDAHAAHSFVHRNKVKTIAFNTFFITKAFHKSLTQHNCDVFHAVVHINLSVALARQIQMETAMHLEQIQHVVQKARP